MKSRKRVAALFLLAIYLLVMGVPALVTLTCPCVVKSAHGADCGCCCMANHVSSTPQSACGGEHSRLVAHHCNCNHSHDTEVELYTLPSTDNDRLALRCVVFALPATIACQAPIFDFTLTKEERARLRSEQHSPQCSPRIWSLRAPPVVA